MDQQQLAPVADVLIQAYGDTARYTRWFNDEFDAPPSKASKGANLRAAAQVRFVKHDRYDLGRAFWESGRIQITDRESGRLYLLRSLSTVNIEQFKSQREALFNSADYLDSDVIMLIHQFHAGGLDLSIAGTRHASSTSRLEASGAPTFIGCWPYFAGEGFDQDEADLFDDVGRIDDDEAGNEV
jgi:hypothetical protein